MSPMSEAAQDQQVTGTREQKRVMGLGTATGICIASMIGMDVLRHRIILTYEAEAENVTADDILKSLFDTIEVP